MRPLTETETQTLFRKLAEYTGVCQKTLNHIRTHTEGEGFTRKFDFEQPITERPPHISTHRIPRVLRLGVHSESSHLHHEVRPGSRWNLHRQVRKFYPRHRLRHSLC